MEFDRATGSTVDQRMSQLITDEAPLAVTEPVIMEVTAGARTDERATDLRRLLTHVSTARLRCRWRPTSAVVTMGLGLDSVDGLIDCMIASVARRHEATLLAADRDLGRVAAIVGLELDDASARP